MKYVKKDLTSFISAYKFYKNKVYLWLDKAFFDVR